MKKGCICVGIIALALGAFLTIPSTDASAQSVTFWTPPVRPGGAPTMHRINPWTGQTLHVIDAGLMQQGLKPQFKPDAHGGGTLVCGPTPPGRTGTQTWTTPSHRR